MTAQRPLGRTEHMRWSPSEVAEVVIFQEPFGIEAVADIRESIGGVFAGFL